MKLYQKKMTDLEVIQRVLDFWDPLGTQLHSGGGLGQIGEYDSYSFEILDLLRQDTSEDRLTDFLDSVRFKSIGLERTQISEAKNRFYGWALLQTWNRQSDKDSNFRLTTDSQIASTEEWRRVSKLEILQKVLQDWDPLDYSKHWLYGADTLKSYDQSAQILHEAVETSDIKEICNIIELVSTTHGDKIGFLISNRNLKGVTLENAFTGSIVQKSERNSWLANNLIILFAHWWEPSRRIRPRISKVTE